MSNTERKQYDETMVGLSGFGQLFTPAGCNSVSDYVLSLLKPVIPATTEVTWEQLNQNVVESFGCGKELNLRKENDLYVEDVFSEKTEIFGISTGFTGVTAAEEGSGSEIYGFFYRYEGVWIGIHFSTKEQMLGSAHGTYVGKLFFTDHQKKLEFLSAIKENLLPGEVWSFNDEEHLEILEDYMMQVSEKLYDEHNLEGAPNHGKIIFSDNESMVLFHSGLLNKFTGDIFMVGTKRSFSTGGFLIQNPMLVTGAKDLLRNGFDPSSCPEKAEFFSQLEELNFDATSSIVLDEVKLGEIVEDASERGYFPEAYETLCQNGAWSTMVGLLRTAIEKAQKIAKHRCYYVIPRYTAPIGTRPCGVQFMMPIYLQTDLTKEPDFLGNPDFVLVLQPSDEGYIPESIIKLTQAYHSGKMITTPDNAWLQGNSISYSPIEILQRFILSQQKNLEELVDFIAEEKPQLVNNATEEETADTTTENGEAGETPVDEEVPASVPQVESEETE